MNWFKGYAECYYCKDQNGPWIVKDQKFICEDCYEKEIKNENRDKRRKTDDDTRD